MLVDVDSMKTTMYRDRYIAHLPKAGGTNLVTKEKRARVIISTASIFGGREKKRRRVMYRGHVSERFVAYMDPTEEWYFRMFMNIGEFEFGRSVDSLQPGIDCPKNTVFMDGYMGGGDRVVQQVARAIWFLAIFF
ncbi:primary amine oxidase 1 [Senna tora]|uniref:Amine oxidase n=1 Tax=Senna tora TaxID=362788 RepID=A0A834WKU1_9FABA|nr:primary amine oxidase 1 [Senna tora]